MKYKKNDQAKVINYTDYSKLIYFSSSDFVDEHHVLQVVTIPPHTRQRLHYHTTQTEVSYILQGEALFIFNKEEILANVGDSFICEPKDRHFVWNKSDEEFKLVVFKIDFPKENDTIWLEK